MATKPAALIYQCRQCGWKTRYAPPSDALVELPPERCAACGSTRLDATPASVMDHLNAAFSMFIGKDDDHRQK
jgi:DNA-directed RNA polymerase subunit RPC12/RpoP